MNIDYNKVQKLLNGLLLLGHDFSILDLGPYCILYDNNFYIPLYHHRYYPEEIYDANYVLKTRYSYYYFHPREINFKDISYLSFFPQEKIKDMSLGCCAYINLDGIENLNLCNLKCFRISEVDDILELEKISAFRSLTTLEFRHVKNFDLNRFLKCDFSNLKTLDLGQNNIDPNKNISTLLNLYIPNVKDLFLYGNSPLSLENENLLTNKFPQLIIHQTKHKGP